MVSLGGLYGEYYIYYICEVRSSMIITLLRGSHTLEIFSFLRKGILSNNPNINPNLNPNLVQGNTHNDYLNNHTYNCKGNRPPLHHTTGSNSCTA